MATKATKPTAQPVMPTAAQASRQSRPVPTPTNKIEAHTVITVSLVEGQNRTKYIGFLDEAETIQVSLYYPSGQDLGPEGEVLTILKPVLDKDGEVVSWLTGVEADDRCNPSQGVERTRRGSVKHAWGDLSESDAFAAAVFMPQRAQVVDITAVLA